MSEAPKRKMLTPAEKIAKAEAELAAAKAAAKAKDEARYTVLQEQQTKLIAKRDAVRLQLEGVQAEIREITTRHPEIGTSAEVVSLPETAAE